MSCQSRIYNLCSNGISKIKKCGPGGPGDENISCNNIFNNFNILDTINQLYKNIQDITSEFNDFTNVDIVTIRMFAKSLKSTASIYLNIKINEELTNELNKAVENSDKIIEILNDCNYEITKDVKIYN